jgi:hypothetical protein
MPIWIQRDARWSALAATAYSDEATLQVLVEAYREAARVR